MQTNMKEAKSKLSQLVEVALSGEEIIIAKSGKPVAQIIPYKKKTKRVFGTLSGAFSTSPDFDSKQTNDEIADMFGTQ